MWGAILQDARRTSPDALCEDSGRNLPAASVEQAHFQGIRARSAIRSLVRILNVQYVPNGNYS
jgi:hypothetical protein